MKKDEPIPPSRTGTDRASGTVAAMEETIDELEARVEELEAERQALLTENRSLRQQLTQMRLLRDLEDSIDEIEQETNHPPAAPPPADALYTLLPPSFAFPVFFQIAEGAGLDSDETRQCLLHFLAEDRIVQEGSRLVKAQTADGPAD